MDERIEKLVALVYHGYQVAPLSSNVTQSLQEIERKLVSVIVDNLKNMQTAVLKGLIDFIGKSNHNEGSEDQTVDGDGRTDEPPSADRRDCPSNNTHAEDADGRINEVLLDLNEVLDDLPHVITL
ncbi:Uncharacterized protein Rs2_21610 [Raphanus sativus]|nr:Uncharacterized protein Rs2_21610 [Raphanus sativus]